jgi:hypothetical protein
VTGKAVGVALLVPRAPRDPSLPKEPRKRAPTGGDRVVSLPVAEDLRPFIQALAEMLVADLLSAPKEDPKDVTIDLGINSKVG